MKILAVGDLVGECGLNILKQTLPKIRKEKNIDFVIVNAENVASGMGITAKDFNELLKLKDKVVIAIIDEGRARKREERGIIRGIYDRVFTIEINNVLTSFSYSDLICKTIIIKTV